MILSVVTAILLGMCLLTPIPFAAMLCFVAVSLPVIFVSAKFITWGGLKNLYLKAGFLGAGYGLICAALLGVLRAAGISYESLEYLLNKPAQVKEQGAHLADEAGRLSIELALLQNGVDFAIKGAILVIAITYLLKRSGIPWRQFTFKRTNSAP